MFLLYPVNAIFLHATLRSTDQCDRQCNTEIIVNQLQNYNDGNYAAKLCADLVAFGFDDWYLPAAGELATLYQQLGPTDNGFDGSGDITLGDYWSSTERGYDQFYDHLVWGQRFWGPGHQMVIDNFFSIRCRCVRK